MPPITALPKASTNAPSVVMTCYGFIYATPSAFWRPYMQPSNSPTWHNMRFRMPITSNAHPKE
eukprot:15117063-Heterocapsa_arctica.AAC.1